ncbi:MAG: DEAD/DEAH box helicase [Anaerolineae bacterium]|nr:DEAD/DEAH box helicase [Anaerolineae bacterium]
MNAHALKNSLPRIWGAFFGRHGNFTAVQIAAIPSVLEGKNVLLCAPTASGKTEATIAPLIENYLPASRSTSELTILYLLPTRALINDLWARLAAPFDTLHISLTVRTHDFNNFNPQHPSDVLLTTPESLDALLCAHAKVLCGVRAVIIDELHIFEGSVRGDQLRALLQRLRQIRTHAFKVGDTPNAAVQYVALSATLAQPEIVAAHYFPDPYVVHISGNRATALESIALEAESPTALLAYLSTFRQRGWRKALAFCNTRAEVEAYATAVRAGYSPFGESVFVHYSNLERERRHEIEQQFAQAETAICFASSTLELGIDISNIDVALLIGAPGSAESFVQRVGRTNRRQPKAQAACFYRSPLERAMFEALPNTVMRTPSSSFRPSVVIQQIFSILKQSPTAALRFNPLCDLFKDFISPDDIRAILGELQAKQYLKSSRMNEWRADERLNRLIDMQTSEHTPLSIYSNIQTSTGQLKIRDQNTQRVVANVDRQWFQQDVLTLEGRPLNVTWYDGEALWVSSYRGANAAEKIHYVSGRQPLSYELAQQLSVQAGLKVGTIPVIPHADGWLCFHWLGDIYGHALLDLTGYTLAVEETKQSGLCLLLRDEPRTFPIWNEQQVERYLRENYHRYETMLSLGAYHHFLPVELRRRTVVEQFSVLRFLQAIQSLHIERTHEALTNNLEALLE